MFAKRILATAGTLALAAGLSAGLASPASAAYAPPTYDGHTVSHVSGPVQGGGGVWAYARYTQFDSLYLVSAIVTPAVPAVVGPPAVAAVPGYTTFTYSLAVRDDGVFTAIPGALTPNQFFAGMKIRGPVSGDLNGYATYTFSKVVTDTTLVPVPVDPALAAIPAILPAPVFGSTTYTASGIHWSYVDVDPTGTGRQPSVVPLGRIAGIIVA